MNAIYFDPTIPSRATVAPSRAQVEDFLYLEAELLDSWRLDEWLELFEEGATYLVPSTDTPDGTADTSLCLIADNWARLQARVKRLKSRNAHIENPHSRTRRIISNVRVAPGEEADTVSIQANFVIYRMRYEMTDLFVGTYRHIVSYQGGELRFRHRKAVLDLEALRPVGKVSVVL